jgi:hypothetical protein
LPDDEKGIEGPATYSAFLERFSEHASKLVDPLG